jgi:hypothetical protein
MVRLEFRPRAALLIAQRLLVASAAITSFAVACGESDTRRAADAAVGDARTGANDAGTGDRDGGARTDASGSSDGGTATTDGGTTASCPGSFNRFGYGYCALSGESRSCETAMELDNAADARWYLDNGTGAPNDLAVTCNSYDIGECGGELFYRFSLDRPMDTQIFIEDWEEFLSDGEDWAFHAPSLFRLEDGCPADVASLTPYQHEGQVMCGELAESLARFRMPSLPAGEYLLVVDHNDWDHDCEAETGWFRLRVRSYESGFPPPRACLDAELVPLPAVGEDTTIAMDTSVGLSELEVDLTGTNCSAGPPGYPQFGDSFGRERMVVLEPERDARVRFTLERLDNDSSPAAAMYLQESAGMPCGDNPVVQCESIGNPREPTHLTADLDAGTTYYLFVDGDPVALTVTTVE